MSNFELQPLLENELVFLRPLVEGDYETVYTMASDPLIWEQHPTRDRYKREVFDKYFQGAVESKGAFVIYNKKAKQPIGCTRYYKYNPEDNSIGIGYTFLTRDHWKGTYNSAVKSLMINHAFRFVSKIIFEVGVNNIRSQKAVEKLGAVKVREEDVVYYGDPVGNHNVVYELDRVSWNAVSSKVS